MTTNYRTESPMDTFTTLRAEWKAAGCPIEHPYLTMELPVSPIVPLIEGITPEMVTSAKTFKFVERPL